MTSNTNAKVNPFYIHDDEEDPWDDDDDEYGADEDIDDEQVMLIGGNGGGNNRKYNVPSTFLNSASSTLLRHRPPAPFGLEKFSQSYQDGTFDMHNRHRHHRPQLLKYLIIFITIAIIVVFRTDQRAKSVSGGMVENKFRDDDEFQIVVLGERHSGADWMRDRLRECFPHVKVSTKLQRSGYFFQDDEETVRSVDELLVSGGEKQTPAEDYQDTFVVHMTLNPYDWLEQMRLSPEYAPDHTGRHKEMGHVVPLGWQEFLNKPWTTDRTETDLLLANETGPVCQMGFHYDEVVSCSGSASGIGDPMYELQREKEGLPFESIIDLRSAKLQNHHNVQESWPSVKKLIQIQYEYVPQVFKNLLEEVLEFSNRNKNETDSVNEALNLPCSGNVLPPSLDSSNGMTREYVDFVKERVDWEIEEAFAAYVSWTESEIAAKGIRPAPVPPSQEEDAAAAEAGATNANEDITVEEAPDEVTIDTEEETSPTESLPPPSDESDETNVETSAEDQTQATEANGDGAVIDEAAESSGEVSSPRPPDQSSEPVVESNAEGQPIEIVANIDDPEINDSGETAETEVTETANESPTSDNLIESETTEAAAVNNALSSEEESNEGDAPKQTEVSANNSVAADENEEEEEEPSSVISVPDEKEAPVLDTSNVESSGKQTETTVDTAVENTTEENSNIKEAEASASDILNEETQLAENEIKVVEDSKPPSEPTSDNTAEAKEEEIEEQSVTENEKENNDNAKIAPSNPETDEAQIAKEEPSATEEEKAEGDAKSNSVENSSGTETESVKDPAVDESKSENNGGR